MKDKKEIIYDSADPDPNDEFWLEQGKKMVEGSLSALQDAAKSLITGLGLLKAFYIGILGFAEYIPKNMPIMYKSLFLIPLLFWLAALYSCLQVMMTRRLDIILCSPDDIRKKFTEVLLEKQSSLKWAYWLLTIGIFFFLFLLLLPFKKF